MPEIHDIQCIHVHLYLASIVPALWPTYKAFTN